ncbi:TPA: hypothetical protein OZL71_001257 [Legionella pneumophila]|nr:hypothetical protein [Legionella pneumophila]
MNFNIFENIIETIIYYDKPVLFISNLNNKLYLCTLIKINDESEDWLASEISETTYRDLKSGLVDYYTCFKNSVSGNAQILEVKDCKITNLLELKSSELLDENLPNKNVYYTKLRNRRLDNPVINNRPYF